MTPRPAAPRSRGASCPARSSGISPFPSSMTMRCRSRSNVLQQRRQQRQQRAVDEDDLVVGVVDDVRQLLGKEADVQRVQHPPGARRGEVQLEVAGGVPGERRHPAVGGDLQVVEHAAEPARALGPVAVGDPLAPGRRRRRHRLVREVLLGPVEQVRDGQRDVLHRALHAARVPAGPPVASCRGSDPQRRRGRASGQRRRSERRRPADGCRRQSRTAPVVGAADPGRLRRADHLHERRQRGVGELGQHQARRVSCCCRRASATSCSSWPAASRRSWYVVIGTVRIAARLRRLPPDRPGLPRPRCRGSPATSASRRRHSTSTTATSPRPRSG